MHKTSTATTAKTTPLPANQVIHRQCACGNHSRSGSGECESCSKQKLQRKLSIGASNDPLELEADRVADQVLAYQPAHSFSNIFAPKIQRRAEHLSAQAEEVPASVERVLAGSGNPLPPMVRKDMEQRFGQDFSQVRIHQGSAAEKSAHDVNANAYTLGNNIVFGARQFNPDSHTGKHLLAHELTHVVQQSSSSSGHTQINRSPITGVLRRETRRGAAGGCGICMNDPGGKQAGGIAHAEIQAAMMARNPKMKAEYAIKVVEKGLPAPFIPKIDLAYRSVKNGMKIMNIGEIKPLDDAGKQAGIARQKLQDYARELLANPELKIDEVFRMRDAPETPLPFFNPLHPPGCPPQIIHVKRTEPGIYQYYCEPPFSSLVKDPRCKCKKKNDEEEKKKMAKPQDKSNEEEQDQEKPNEQPKAQEKSPDSSVLPEVAIGVGAAAAATLAAKAYLRKQAEKRAAQLAWRKMAEAAAKRRAAQAAGKGAAGKAVGKAVVYAEIAAAVALILVYPERVEAKPGLGPSPIETLYKAMTTNGTPPSPEMKKLIESDPLLKQMAEEAAGSGDGSKIQEEMTRRMLELIRDNPEMFTPEDLEFLTEYSKTAKTGSSAAPTADELRKAIDAAKAGKKPGDGKSEGDAKADSGTVDPSAKGNDGGAAKESSADENSSQTGTPSTETPSDSADKSKISAENKKKIEEATQPVAKLFKEFASGQKEDLKLDDSAVEKFFEIVPGGLTEQQVEELIKQMQSSKGKTLEEILASLKQAIEEQAKKVPESGNATQDADAQKANSESDPDKPKKSQEEIIQELQEIAKKFDFSKIPKGQFDIQKIAEKINGTQFKTYIYANFNGVGVVGYISGTVPEGDYKKLKAGQTITITITHQSPLVDKIGKVHEIKLDRTLHVKK